MEENKIAILYIATGRYITFFKEFYESCEEYLLQGSEKTYFVFTDNETFEHCDEKNVKTIRQEKLGWPYDTLMRFDMFLRVEDDLKNFDYTFFFNANMKFLKPVGEEILPKNVECGLVMGLHPGEYKKTPSEFAYDRNPKSSAYIPIGEGKYYVQGCLNGGKTEAYLKLCHTCNDNTKKDLENDVIALWHDESQLNKYILDKEPLILPCNYLYPEKWNIPEFKKDIKIIQRDKKHYKYGGHAYLRGEVDRKITPVKYFLNKIFGLKLT